MPEKNLVLAGFMGTGKSSIGRLVARKTHTPFIDTDAQVERQAGKSIAAIFADEGEAHFRALEAAACVHAAQAHGSVIATGGGALVDPESKARLAENGLLVNLHADFEFLAARVTDNGRRPLFQDRAAAKTLYEERAPLYRSLPYQMPIARRKREDIAEELIALWQQHG